ncbi:MAG: hypothetical protein JF615_10800 [Asticcacaulis sp.]|nr:hypothetical protein [Asticcacaulis sp.]
MSIFESTEGEGIAMPSSDPATAAILDLLRHVQVLAQESGKTSMAGAIDGALRRCVQIHVAEKRNALEDAIFQGRVQ